MEARRTASAQTAPFCSYSRSPPLELKSVSASALKANAGYVSFGEPQATVAVLLGIGLSCSLLLEGKQHGCFCVLTCTAWFQEAEGRPMCSVQSLSVANCCYLCFAEMHSGSVTLLCSSTPLSFDVRLWKMKGSGNSLAVCFRSCGPLCSVICPSVILRGIRRQQGVQQSDY
jgi:hypothetical protein